MFINKLTILFFGFLFVLYCMGNYVPSKFMVGLLILNVVIDNVIEIIRQKQFNKLKKGLGDRDGK